MFFTYVLKSERDTRFYIGHTNNLKDRVVRHNEGRVPATRNRRPLQLVYFEEFNTRGEAVQRERYFKGLKGSSYFRAIIGK
jgi:putative endonuclease